MKRATQDDLNGGTPAEVATSQGGRRPAPWSAPLALFALALWVRCIGLTWGIPCAAHWYSYHPDESQTILAVAQLDFFKGLFDPHFFNYPSLYLYCVSVAHLVAAGWGLTLPDKVLSSTPWAYPHDLVLCGRAVSALCGALTAPLVYWLALKIRDYRTALLAGTFCALMPGFVMHCHFATVDAMATLWVAVTLWLTACWQAQGQPDRDNAPNPSSRYLALAAVAAGLAAASKYNAGLVAIAPIVAVLTANRSQSWSFGRSTKLLIVVALCAVASFLVGCPYCVLSFREFWGDGVNNGFAYEAFVHPHQGSGDIFQQTGNVWWYHLTFNLPYLMTWPLVVAAIVGAIAACSRRQYTQSCLTPTLAYGALYFATLGFSQVRFMRYLLPLVPVLCVLAALGVECASDFSPLRATGIHKSKWQWAIGALLAMVALLGDINVLSVMVATDPRDQAVAFFHAHTNEPVTVGLIDRPWFWTPPLSPQDSPPGMNIDVNGSPDGRYNFLVLGSDGAALAQARPQWFVMSEFEWRDKQRLNEAGYGAFVKVLNRDYRLVGDFKNHPLLELPGRAFVPHDYLYTNPEVRVYQLR